MPCTVFFCFSSAEYSASSANPTTVMVLSSTFQLNGLPFFDCHAETSLPLNKMMASDGGSADVLPGVITLGTGDQISVSAAFLLGANVNSNCQQKK
jgi:hypothetical protein